MRTGCERNHRTQWSQIRTRYWSCSTTPSVRLERFACSSLWNLGISEHNCPRQGLPVGSRTANRRPMRITDLADRRRVGVRRQGPSIDADYRGQPRALKVAGPSETGAMMGRTRGRALNRVVPMCGAIALSLGLVSMFGLDAAQATSPHAVVPGTLSCTGMAGTVKFNPPLTSTGGSAEQVTLIGGIKGCTASGGSSVTPSKGTITGKISTPSNSCSSLLSTTSIVHAEVVWSPKKDGKSTGSFSGYTVLLTPTVGFGLPNSGGSVSGQGSYAGSDGGNSSTVTVFTSLTQSQALNTCVASGLKKFKITSGTLHLG